jgi:DNA-directed RNA polymerase specialized sigma24 family protein
LVSPLPIVNDVFQTVCLKLIEYLQDLKDESKVSSWPLTTTTRHCIHVRSMKHRDVSDEEGMEATPDPDESSEEAGIRSDREQKFREARWPPDGSSEIEGDPKTWMWKGSGDRDAPLKC